MRGEELLNLDKVGEDDGPLGNGPRRGLLRERERVPGVRGYIK